MARRGWRRPFAVLLELWLVAVLLGPGVVYTCPEHGRARGAVATPITSVGAHEHHGSPTGSRRRPAVSVPQGHLHCACLCPGDCAGSEAAWFSSRTRIAST